MKMDAGGHAATSGLKPKPIRRRRRSVIARTAQTGTGSAFRVSVPVSAAANHARLLNQPWTLRYSVRRTN